MPATHRRWTRSEVKALIDANPDPTPRYELVDGELLVTPSPIGPHQRAVRGLVVALDPYLVSTGVGEVLTSPFDVELYQRHVPEYWIVDLDAALFERWRPGDERPEILRERIEWQPVGAFMPLGLELNDFFDRAAGTSR